MSVIEMQDSNKDESSNLEIYKIEILIFYYKIKFYYFDNFIYLRNYMLKNLLNYMLDYYLNYFVLYSHRVI